jgi:hypothetical protein
MSFHASCRIRHFRRNLYHFAGRDIHPSCLVIVGWGGNGNRGIWDYGGPIREGGIVSKGSDGLERSQVPAARLRGLGI